jgi:hypothetical protein
MKDLALKLDRLESYLVHDPCLERIFPIEPPQRISASEEYLCGLSDLIAGFYSPRKLSSTSFDVSSYQRLNFNP